MKPGQNILQIPLPGGARAAPTGAVQFRGDAPGLFVRGDHAIRLHAAVRTLQEQFGAHPDFRVANALYALGELAEIIQRHVMSHSNAPRPL